MISHPYPLLRQFSDWLDVRLFTKDDNVSSDESIAKVIGTSRIASLWQVHGAHAVIVREPTLRTMQADAMATDQSHLALTIRVADCQNFVILEPEKKALCTVHAGWKGMRQKVLTAAIELIKREWSVDSTNLFVGAGPSLCTKCAEFTDPRREVPELSAFIDGRSIDLRAAADHELQSLGVPSGHIDRMPDCTRCDPDKFWTYRGGDREKVLGGYGNVLVATLL